MKTSIWICVILTCLIALLIIVPHIFITNTVQEVKTILKQADYALKQENWDDAINRCKHLTKKWEEYSIWFEMVTEHQGIDEISRSIRQLSRFAQEQELPEARAIIAELGFLVDHLEETDTLSAENIF